MATIVGKPVATFGLVGDTRKLSFDGFPAGARIRVRLRNDNFAEAFVKHDRGIERWYVLINEDTMVVTPGLLKESNVRDTPRPPGSVKGKARVRIVESVYDLQELANPIQP